MTEGVRGSERGERDLGGAGDSAGDAREAADPLGLQRAELHRVVHVVERERPFRRVRRLEFRDFILINRIVEPTPPHTLRHSLAGPH